MVHSNVSNKHTLSSVGSHGSLNFYSRITCIYVVFYSTEYIYKVGVLYIMTNTFLILFLFLEKYWKFQV